MQTDAVAKGRIFGWLGWAGLDAVGRLVLLTISTLIMSRMLDARAFGVGALVLAIVASASLFVGAPFEEALTQRRVLRRIHLRAALGLSWVVGLVLFGLSLVLADSAARWYGVGEIAFLLPLGMVSIFFSGHSDILTAMARRLRRFNDVAIATLFGHVIGIALSLVLAMKGYGALALVGQRVLVVLFRAIILQWRLGFIVLPAWSPSHVRDFARFSGVSFLSRLTDNLTYLVFNNLVQIFYGLSVLGQVNMAMRLIEPVRGAIVATGHNLAFSFFTRAGRNPTRLRGAIDVIVPQSAFAIVPVFVGIAAVSPVLLPLVAGPNWGDAANILACLAIASAIGVPAGLIFTAFSADGHPELSLASLVASLVAIIAVLVGFSWLGPISVGLSRIVGDSVRAAFAIGITSMRLDWPRSARLWALLPAWFLAAVMGIMIAPLSALAPQYPMMQLLVMVAAGMVVYVALIRIFARTTFDHFVALTPFRRSGTA